MSRSAIRLGLPWPQYVVETTSNSAILPGLYSVETNVIPFAVDAGSVTLSGQAASFKTSLTAGTGSFSLAGQSATFRGSLAASRGTFTLAGQDVSGIPFGAYVLTGEAATLRISLAAASGTSTLTGEATVFVTKLAAGYGSHTLSGQVAALTLSADQKQTAVTIICG